MAKNKNMQNPEAENLRREEADTVEKVSPEDVAETDKNDEISLEDLLLTDEDDTAEQDDLLLKDFGADLMDPEEVLAEADDAGEEKQDMDAFAPPPEEEPAEKKGLIAGLFAQKAGQELQDAQKPADEPVMDTDELSFVTDSVPVAAGMAAADAADADDEEPEATETEAEVPKPEKAKPAGPAKMVMTLTVICGIVALLLSVVNAVTADVIAGNAVKKQSDAILRIFTDGTDVVPYGETGDTWLVYRDDVVLGYCAAVSPMGYVDEIL